MTGDLQVKHIEQVSWNKNAFDRLVLEPHKKELIEALVSVHLANSVSNDIIEGKGNGLVILLHGGPGKNLVSCLNFHSLTLPQRNRKDSYCRVCC